MKTDPWKILTFILGGALLIGAVGDVVESLEVNPNNGLLLNNYVVTTSNQWKFTATPSDPEHVVRRQDLTNSSLLDLRYWNIPSEPSNAVLLGSLTVSNDVLVANRTMTSSTNNSSTYQLGGVVLYTGVETNYGNGTTNIKYIVSGVVTNIFKNP